MKSEYRFDVFYISGFLWNSKGIPRFVLKTCDSLRLSDGRCPKPGYLTTGTMSIFYSGENKSTSR